MTAVDAKTVRLTMSEPFAPLLPALSTFAASIYQKANFEKQGDKAGEQPMGTGAFMLDSWNKGQEVVLVKNPNYWQAGKQQRAIFHFREAHRLQPDNWTYKRQAWSLTAAGMHEGPRARLQQAQVPLPRQVERVPLNAADAAR